MNLTPLTYRYKQSQRRQKQSDSFVISTAATMNMDIEEDLEEGQGDHDVAATAAASKQQSLWCMSRKDKESMIILLFLYTLQGNNAIMSSKLFILNTMLIV